MSVESSSPFLKSLVCLRRSDLFSALNRQPTLFLRLPIKHRLYRYRRQFFLGHKRVEQSYCHRRCEQDETYQYLGLRRHVLGRFSNTILKGKPTFLLTKVRPIGLYYTTGRFCWCCQGFPSSSFVSSASVDIGLLYRRRPCNGCFGRRRWHGYTGSRWPSCVVRSTPCILRRPSCTLCGQPQARGEHYIFGR